MTDRLTDDEIKALRQDLHGYHITVAMRKAMLRLLDEIEERRRAERSVAADDSEVPNFADKLVRDAWTDVVAKREQWLETQARSRGLTPAQMAERFCLEVKRSVERDDVGQTRYVERLRLFERKDGGA